MQTAPSTPSPTPPIQLPPSPGGPDDLEQLGERIAELAAQITAATFQLLTLIRDFDRTNDGELNGILLP